MIRAQSVLDAPICLLLFHQTPSIRCTPCQKELEGRIRKRIEISQNACIHVPFPSSLDCDLPAEEKAVSHYIH